MRTTINNHLEQLHLSATRMLVLNSDNSMLISYFKDLNEKLVYLKQLMLMDSKYDWIEIENQIEELKNQDEQLNHININMQVRDIKTDYNVGLIKVKL